jgi:hypothetical protein
MRLVGGVRDRRHAVAVASVYVHPAPRRALERIVRRLLDRVPCDLTAGLKEVRLLDAPQSRDARRSKPQRLSAGVYADAEGMYCRDSIELYVDNLLAHWPGWCLYLPLIGSYLVGRALYHEIGHHISAVTRPTHRATEATAEAWARTLLSGFFRGRYWPLVPLGVLLRPLIRVIERWVLTGLVGPSERR